MTRELAELLKHARTTKNLSQAQLAALSNVSPRTITEIENQKDRKIRYGMVVKLAEALGKDIPTWLRAAGYSDTSPGRIEGFLKNSSIHFDGEGKPEVFFQELKRKIGAGAALVSVVYSSPPTTIHRGEIDRHLTDLLNGGQLWVNLIVPYPVNLSIEKVKRPNLAKYYRKVYEEVILIARQLRGRVKHPDNKGRLKVFTPDVPDSCATMFMPHPGVSELRFVLVKYFHPENEEKFELAIWATVAQDKTDRWIKLFPVPGSNSDTYDDRVGGGLHAWSDYFAEFVDIYKYDSMNGLTVKNPLSEHWRVVEIEDS